MPCFVLGIIPDGNRRFAKKYGITFREAYMKGVETAKKAISYISEVKKITHVYFYTLSLENLKKRSEAELKILFSLLEKEIDRVLKDNPWNARIKVIGRVEELPKRIQKKFSELEKKTDGENGVNIALAVAYSGKMEIVDAVKRIIAAKVPPEEVNEDVFYSALYAPDFPPPDVIVRTSGEQRLSGFLPYQSVYSELVFYPKLWPEMDVPDFERIIREYEGRERRFGK